ncbi:MAG TPA: MoaD/ThiS family protein [Phycisphaerales bacterium]|nr:MoaD/ThiS family protein [Phycisphaerales bacterium]
MPKIRFTNRLVRHVDCPAGEVQGATVLEALRSYFETNSEVEGYVLDECESLRPNMAIFVDGQPISDRCNLHQAVDRESVIDVIQALTGG